MILTRKRGILVIQSLNSSYRLPSQVAATKQCHTACQGFWQLEMEARAGDIMAGGAGAAGPASNVRPWHQPAGDVYHQQFDIRHTNTTLWLIFSEALAVQSYREPCIVREIMGSSPNIMTMFCFCTYWLVQRYPRFYWDIQGCIEIYLDVLPVRHPSMYELTRFCTRYLSTS